MERHLLGPLTDLQLVALFFLTFGLTFCFGLLEVGYPAYATALHWVAFGGILLALNAIGSAVGGFIYGALHLSMSLERQFTISLAIMSIPLFLHGVVNQHILFVETWNHDIQCRRNGIAYEGRRAFHVVSSHGRG